MLRFMKRQLRTGVLPSTLIFRPPPLCEQMVDLLFCPILEKPFLLFAARPKQRPAIFGSALRRHRPWLEMYMWMAIPPLNRPLYAPYRTEIPARLNAERQFRLSAGRLFRP